MWGKDMLLVALPFLFLSMHGGGGGGGGGGKCVIVFLSRLIFSVTILDRERDRVANGRNRFGKRRRWEMGETRKEYFH